MWPILLSVVTYITVTGALITPRQASDGNDGIHLAVKPQCGPLSGSTADVNAGIDLSKYKTIVSFGVSCIL